MSPLLLYLLATDRVNARLAQAAQDALADQLPGRRGSRPDVVTRHYLASMLCVLVARLDPRRLCTSLDFASKARPQELS
jgi:hypothetical protein